MSMNESVFVVSHGWAGQERSALRIIRKSDVFWIEVMGIALPPDTPVQQITMLISKEEAKKLHEWLTRELT